MPESRKQAREDRIRAEVDRAVAPYVGMVPPFMLAKLRELAERYWREQPQAARVIDFVTRDKNQVRSGVEETGEGDDGEAEQVAGERKG